MEKLIVTPIISEYTTDELRIIASQVWKKHYKAIPNITENIAKTLIDSKKSIFSYEPKRAEILYYFVDNAERERIGYFEVRRTDEYVVSIKAIYIRPQDRGKRFGRRMLRLIEKFAKSKGMVYILVECPTIDLKATKFFKSNGYKSEGKWIKDRFSDNKMMAQLLGKQLIFKEAEMRPVEKYNEQ